MRLDGASMLAPSASNEIFDVVRRDQPIPVGVEEQLGARRVYIRAAQQVVVPQGRAVTQKGHCATG